VATYLRCDNTFNHDFVTDIRQNFNANFFLKSFGQRLAKLRAKIGLPYRRLETFIFLQTFKLV